MYYMVVDGALTEPTMMPACSVCPACCCCCCRADAAAVAAYLPKRVKGVGLFGPTDPLAGGRYDGGCCCCADATAGACAPHERWRGKPGCPPGVSILCGPFGLRFTYVTPVLVTKG
jgi:hypothetical protein